MLKHGIDQLAARAQLASNPFRQLRAIHPLHAVISKMDQDLRTMPSCCPTGKVITGYLASQIGRATSELQSLMRNSYAVFCLKKNKTIPHDNDVATQNFAVRNHAHTTVDEADMTHTNHIAPAQDNH